MIMVDSRNLSSSLREGTIPFFSARVSIHMELSGISSGTRSKEGSARGPAGQSCSTIPARSRAAWEWLGKISLQIVQQRTSRTLRCMDYAGKKEKLRELCFSGLEKTKQVGESNGSLLAVYLQGLWK